MIDTSVAIAGHHGSWSGTRTRGSLTFVPIFFLQPIEVPALVFLGIWFLMQFVSVAGHAGRGVLGRDGGGVAFWAHAAGLRAGAVGFLVFRRPERQRVERWSDV